ncbi:hypothetical protein Tco_1226293 [Tanacetum coccineum]
MRAEEGGSDVGERDDDERETSVYWRRERDEGVRSGEDEVPVGMRRMMMTVKVIRWRGVSVRLYDEFEGRRMELEKCVFNVNHDACVTNFRNEVDSDAKVPSHKITNINKPVEHISIAKKPERQISTRHMFSIKKTSSVHEKTTPISCLRWKPPMRRICKTIGLRWIPTEKLFTSCTIKVGCKPPHDYNADITNIHECKQTLDLSACTSINVQKEYNFDLSACTSFNLKKFKSGPEVVSHAYLTDTSSLQELELLFTPLFDEYFNGGNHDVSNSFALSDNHQKDTSPQLNVQPTLEPSNPTTNVNAEEKF